MILLDLNPILEKRKLSALKNGLVDSSDALKAINRECEKLCKQIIKEEDDMEPIYWRTEDPHFNNQETMQDYLNNGNMLDITLVDGTYAEGVNCDGVKYEIHAGGNGDSFNHVITFKRLNP